MTRSTLEELLARCERATGSDRDLDWSLHCFLPEEQRGQGVPSYTDSIDAIVGLIERELPGVFWHIAKGETREAEPLYGAALLFGTDEAIGTGESDATPALALAAAFLRAKLSTLPGGDE